MNALLYVLSELRFTIPNEVLHAAFTCDELPNLVNLTSLDEKITRKCIKARVLVDANIVRGIETVISLNTVTPNLAENYYTIYQIPPELVQNKEILSVLGLTYNTNQFYGGMAGANVMPGGSGFQPYNALMGVASRIGNSAADASILSNTHLELVGYNTVVVHANYRMLANYGIRIVVENEQNLQNISPRSYKDLSYLCTLAVKSYIFNKLTIRINQGYLQGGQELGQFKNIIDSYEGAEELYREFLRNTWKTVSFMNDTTSMNRFVRGLISPGL
jgi:hypothetical protein